MSKDLADIGSRPATICTDSTPVAQVARMMGEHSIGAVVVVNDESHLVGIVTDRDLALRIVGRELGPETPVSEAMTQEVATVLNTASSLDAARQMATRDCRRLPVVDAAGEVIAVLSLDDLYRAESAVLEQIDRVLAVERAPRRKRS